MQLSEQVTNLEISKKLKELGVEQESHFRWGENIKGWSIYGELSIPIPSKVYEGKKIPDGARAMARWQKENSYSAFTVAELGEMLPAKILNIQHKGLAYGFYFKHPKLGAGSETEVESRGKMLIYLLENKLI